MAFEYDLDSLLGSVDPDLAQVPFDAALDRLARKNLAPARPIVTAAASAPPRYVVPPTIEADTQEAVPMPRARPKSAPARDWGMGDDLIGEAPEFGKGDELVGPAPTAEMPPVQDLDTAKSPVKPMPPVQGLDLPAPPPPPVVLQPTGPMPPVQEMEGAPFRAPGSGMATNMLTGDEAFQARKDSIAGAETSVAEAQQRLDAAMERKNAIGSATQRRGTPGQQQRLSIEDEVDRARANLESAKRGLAAAERSAPPTQTATRDAASRFATAIGQAVPDTVGGIMRPVDAALDAVGVKGGTGTAEWMRKQSERIGRANQPDLTRDEELAAKLGQGGGSAVGFVATGIVGKAAGLPAWAASGVAGAAQNAEQYYREADDMGLPAYKKAMAYITGGAIGSTEAIGLGRIADSMDKATGGGVKRYFGMIAKEMGEEGLQEGGQQLLENIAKYGLFGKDPGDITKDVATNALVGAMLGMGMAGTLGAPGLIGGRKAAEVGVPVPDTSTANQEELIRQILAVSAQPPAPPAAVPPPPAAPPIIEATPAASPQAAPEQPEQPAPPQPAPSAEAPQEAPKPTVTDEERGTLRAYGYSTEQIDAMSPANRASELRDAREAGVKPDEFIDGDSRSKTTQSKSDIPGGIPGMEGDEQSVQQPESGVLRPIRRAGDSGVPGVAGEFPGISGTHRNETDTQTLGGPDGQREGLRARQRSVGDKDAAGNEPSGPEGLGNADVLRGDAQSASMGQAAQLEAEHSSRAASNGLAGREGSNAAQREGSDLRGASNAGTVADFGTGDVEVGPAKADIAAAATFTTAKGSTYEIHEDGSTTRNKAARSDPGHEGDRGLKERSAKTVYVDKDAMGAFAVPQDTRWRVIDHGDGTMSLATWNDKANDWGISPESRNVKVSDKPAVGLHPLEVWKPEKIKGLTGFKGMHPGNAITEIRSGDVEVVPLKGKPARAPAPRRVNNEPTSLLQMIAYRGGLKPDAELKAMGLGSKNRVMVPGVGWRSVLRGKGGTMDQLAEWMVEDGFLPPESELRPGDTGLHNQIRDMIDQELRGTPSLRMTDEAGSTKAAAARIDDENAQRDAVLADNRAEIDALVQEYGLPTNEQDVRRAAEIMADEGLSADEALERAAMRAADEEMVDGQDAIADTFGYGAFDDEVLPDSTYEDGPEAERGSERAEGAERAEAEAVVEPVSRAGEDGQRQGETAEGERAEVAAPGRGAGSEREAAEADGRAAVAENAADAEAAEEVGADNKPQLVLPGAEKAPDAKLAQIKADAPLKPKKAQEQMDVGMFGDSAAQTDLMDLASKPRPESGASDSDADGLGDIFDQAVNEQFVAKEKKSEPKPTASWIIKDKETGAVVMETFDRKKVEALNTDKYEAVPIQEHLASLNKAAKSAAKNTVMGLVDVAKGFDALFSPKGKLGSGPSFDEETYAKAKPLFKSGVAHFAQAGRDIADMVRELVRYLAQTAKLDRATIEAIKPYALRFVRDVRDGKETINAPSVGGDLEQDSGKPAARDGVGGTDVPAAGERSGQGARPGGAETVEESGPAGSGSVSKSYAPALGARGNLELPPRATEPPSRSADSGGRERSGDAGSEGLPTDRIPKGEAARAPSGSTSLADREKAQLAAEGVKVNPANAENIRETLPLLFPEQQDDVLKAEQRFAKPDGHGMLFTNGTGTGKTFSGLGVVKRFVKQGKGNVLIVAPSQGILLDWQRSAKLLGIDATVLGGTTDKGKGVTLTTYANLGANEVITDRNWDLVVADEAHKLSSDQGGSATDALRAVRAMTLHPDGMRERAQRVFRKEYDVVRTLSAIKKPSAEQSEDLRKAWRAFEAKEVPAREKWKNEPRPKLLMMSATPFSYHFSLDYANGYLFDFGPEPTSSAYNTPSAREAFYITNFGYHMRTGKLNKPESEVNSEIMERQFHEKLKREGSLSGRALTVDKDYDRKFVLVDDAVGQRIDQALDFLISADNGRFRFLYDYIGKRFDYLARMRLLEAIKARAAVKYIREQHALNRKVVVFHDYNEGGGFNPFDLQFDEKSPAFTTYVDGKPVAVKPADLYREFLARNPYIKDLDFAGFRAPIAELTAHFPEALVYNGTVSKKKRDEAKAKFNDDNANYDLIIVQSAAGEAGISLHDTTGKKQRVLLNLGMPTRPTSAIQQEGRIYRVGQASNAIFRYMNTGTAWERWTFAGKIAERAGTTENLALGNQARAMRTAFIDAFEGTDEHRPQADEGTGGKESDRSTNENPSEFERAKTHYFAQGKNKKRRDQREGVDYFATPEPIGLKMVEWANIKPGEKILEPSAGHGAIARYFPETTSRTLVEPASELASRAALNSPGARVVVDQFENLPVGANKFDAIVMNPPFGSGGKTAVDHIGKAAKHLRNGGRIVALIPTGPAADAKFDKFMESEDAKGIYLAGNVLLPRVTFERAGTSVAARIVVLDKQTDAENAQQIQQTDRDYSNEETINGLFGRIENAEIKPRIEPKTKEVDAPASGRVTVDGAEFSLNGENDGSAVYADLKNKVGPIKFKTIVRAAEANEGRYLNSIKSFRFPTAEARQKFLNDLANPLPEPEQPTAPSGVTFKNGETRHAKTGAKLFVATPDQRVERDVYDQMSAAAKANGGYYSSFKGNGAIPGFQFKSDEARQAFLKSMKGEVPDTEPKMGTGEVASVRSQFRLSDSPMARNRRAAMEEQLTEIIERLVGRRVSISFEDVIPINDAIGWGKLGEDVQTAAGSYAIARRLIRLAMADPRAAGNERTTAYHEAFHAMEHLIWQERGPERDVLLRERDRLENWILKNMNLGLNETKETLAGLAGYEIRAIAFEGYAMMREAGRPINGLHIAIRRGFEKLMEIMRRIRNYLEGFGYRTAEDVFSDVYEGKVRERADAAERSTFAGAAEMADRGEQFSVRRARPRSGNLPTPGFQVPAETVREAISDPNMSPRERLSAAIDALMLVPSRALWDRLIDLSRFQRAAELASGQPTAQNLDTYLAASIYPGRVGERLKDIEKLVKPIVQALKAHNISRAELHEYLYARHASERNAQIRTIDPNNDAGSGMTDQEAQDILNQAAPRQADFDAVAALVDNMVRFNRDLMEAEGLESSQTLAQWGNAYQHYVPLKGAENQESDQIDPKTGKGFTTRGPESRRALGRFGRAADILTNLLEQTQRTIIRAEKNRVAKTFLRWVQRNPTPLVTHGLAETRREIDKTTGLVETVWVTTQKDARNAFAAKVAGETHYLRIEHDGLLLALKSMDMDRLPPFFAMISRFTRQFAAFQTARNPEFVFSNLSRDLQDAGFNLNAETKKGFQRAFWKHIINGKALMSAVLGQLDKTNNRYGRLYEEWRQAGGKISTFGYKNLETIRKELEDQLARSTESMTRKVISQPGRLVNPYTGHIVKTFEAISDVAESMTRLAVYAAAREVGMTQAMAAKAARSTTVDFQAKGKYGPWISALYAFASPALQGSINLIRRLRRSPKMRAAAGGVAMFGFALTLWNLAAGDDEDDEGKKINRYADLKYHEREKNIVIFWPGKKEPTKLSLGGKLPLGYALAPFFMMGENAAMAIQGKKKPTEAFTDWLGTAAKTFNPLGGEGSIFAWHFWLGAISPTVFDPVVELGRNRNWLNRPIHPDEMPWTKGKPHSEQSKVLTNPLAISAAETFNRWSGGNHFKKGAVDLYPDDLEYAWNFALGGYGKFMANSYGMTADAIAGVDTPPERIPFVRRFVVPNQSDVRDREKFSDASMESTERSRAVRDALKAQKTGTYSEDAQATIEELGPKIGLGVGKRGGVKIDSETTFREANKELSALRQQERAARTNSNLDRAERADIIKELRERQTAIMKAARRSYENISSPPQ